MARSKQRRGPKPGSSRARRRRNDLAGVVSSEVARSGKRRRNHVKVVTGAGAAGVATRRGMGSDLAPDAREKRAEQNRRKPGTSGTVEKTVFGTHEGRHVPESEHAFKRRNRRAADAQARARQRAAFNLEG